MNYPVIIFLKMPQIIIVILLSLLLLLIVILLISKFKVTIKYTKKEKDDNILLIYSAVGGLWKVEYEIPMADIWQSNNRTIKIYKKYRKKTVEKVVDIGGLIDKYNFIRKANKRRDTFISKADSYLVSSGRILIEEFKLIIIVGLNDAFWTGIISGIIWTLLGNIESFISNKYKVSNKYLFVKPDYLKEVLDIDFLCIISLKTVHAIIVRLTYIISRIQDRIYDGRWFKWQSIR